jgi:hypothetical protein
MFIKLLRFIYLLTSFIYRFNLVLDVINIGGRVRGQAVGHRGSCCIEREKETIVGLIEQNRRAELVFLAHGEAVELVLVRVE